MDTEPSKSLADRLIAADESGELETPPAGSADIDPWFERILQEERRFEKRVSRIALISWALTLACLIGATFAIHIIRYSGSADTMIDLARSLLILTFGIGVISLLAAIVTSITLLFRSRTPTLRVIERRLRALEELVLRRQ